MKLPAFLTSSFKKPKGFLGRIIASLMTKHNFFVYPELDKYADIKDGMKILEIGFGTGIGIKYFFNKYNIKIHGIDFSALMCAQAEKKFSDKIKNNKLSVTCMDFTKYQDDSPDYDRIIFSNVSYFIEDLTNFFDKIKKFLKENGKLTFYMTDAKTLKNSPLTHEKHFIFYSLEKVMGVLKDLDFKNIQYRQINEKLQFTRIITAEK